MRPTSLLLLFLMAFAVLTVLPSGETDSHPAARAPARPTVAFRRPDPVTPDTQDPGVLTWAEAARLLESDERADRERAATVLASMASAPEGLDSLLLRLIADPSPLVRRSAVRALHTAPTLDTECSGHLVDLLRDPDDSVRSLAAAALSRKEARGHPGVVPALLRASRDPVVDVRWAALEALAVHHPDEPAEVLGVWVGALEDRCVDVRSIAANCIQGLGTEGRAAAPHLERAMLRTSEPFLEWELSDALNAVLGK